MLRDYSISLMLIWATINLSFNNNVILIEDVGKEEEVL